MELKYTSNEVHCFSVVIPFTAKKSGGQLAVIDGEIEVREGRLDRIYEFMVTKTVDFTRMAQRFEEVQDKIGQLKRTRREVDESALGP
jgi:hypothetical protein